MHHPITASARRSSHRSLPPTGVESALPPRLANHKCHQLGRARHLDLRTSKAAAKEPPGQILTASIRAPPHREQRRVLAVRTPSTTRPSSRSCSRELLQAVTRPRNKKDLAPHPLRPSSTPSQTG